MSLLSQFSSDWKLFLQNLIIFIEKNKLLSESQYGFLTNLSTASALKNVIKEIATAIESKKYSTGVFIDFYFYLFI